MGIKGEMKRPQVVEKVPAERRNVWKPKEPKYKKGVLKLFSDHGLSQMNGGYLD